jgi:large-conductance mechanosensitive channel
LGLCVPSICSVSDFTTFKPFIVAAFNDIIDELFDNVKGFNPNLQLSLDDLVFDDSVKRNKEATRFDGGTLLIIIFILFFVISSIISTAMLFRAKKEKQRKRASRESRAQ